MPNIPLHELPEKDPSNIRQQDHGATSDNLEIEIRSLEAILLQKSNDAEKSATDSESRAEDRLSD